LSTLKGTIASSSTKALKQIDIAYRWSRGKLLLESGNFCEKAEGFIFRLIASDNPNSRFLAFNFVARYGVFTELAIERIVKLGAHNPFPSGGAEVAPSTSPLQEVYQQRRRSCTTS